LQPLQPLVAGRRGQAHGLGQRGDGLGGVVLKVAKETPVAVVKHDILRKMKIANDFLDHLPEICNFLIEGHGGQIAR
jgi:hypothetical protein